MHQAAAAHEYSIWYLQIINSFVTHPYLQSIPYRLKKTKKVVLSLLKFDIVNGDIPEENQTKQNKTKISNLFS